MAHFAELDSENIVLRVCVIPDEHEATGEQWCASFFGGGRWKQTSYTGRIRKNFAGIGYVYDEVRNAFIPPKPYASWILDEDACQWVSPVPSPQDGGTYAWNEEAKEWIRI